jgi:hypothetical protein
LQSSIRFRRLRARFDTYDGWFGSGSSNRQRRSAPCGSKTLFNCASGGPCKHASEFASPGERACWAKRRGWEATQARVV